MFVEHLFIFMPGLLFLSGVGLFSWILLMVTSRKSKRGSSRNKADLNAVLTSVSSPVENISIEKFNTFARLSKPVRKQGQPLAGDVYPEPVSIPADELKNEMKSFFERFEQESRHHQELLRTINDKIDKDNCAKSDTMLEQVARLQQEKDRYNQQRLELHSRMDEMLKEKESKLAELIARYEYGHARLEERSVQSRQPHTTQVQVVRDLLLSVRQVRSDARAQLQKIGQERISFEESRRATTLQGQERLQEMLQGSMRIKGQLESDINRITAEIQEMQTTLPEIISEKEEQLAQMNSALELLEGRLTQEERVSRQYMDRFRKHREYQVARATNIFDREKAKSEQRLGEQKAELDRIKRVAEKEEEAVRQKVGEQRKLLESEKAKLTTQRDELAAQYKKESESFENKNAVLEKEVARFKQQLMQKEAEFKNAVSLWEKKRESEKQRLSNSIIELKAELLREQEHNAGTQTEHAEKISSIVQEFDESGERLAVQGKETCDAFKNENIHLHECINAECKRMEFNRQMWADRERKMTEERGTVEQRIQACENNMVREQEKQHASYTMESAELNQQIKDLEEKLKQLCADHKAMLEKSAWEIECLTVKEKRNEEQAREQWLAREAEFVREQSLLKEEIKNLNNQMTRSAEASEKKRQELVSSIKNMRKELSQKQEFADSLMKQQEREYKKMVQPLCEKTGNLRAQLISEKRTYETKLSGLDDKIHTLKLRLAWRDERQQANDAKRQKEIEKFRVQLNKEIDVLRIKSQKLSSKQDCTLEPFVREYERISQELKATKEKLEAEKGSYEEVKKNRLAIGSEINQIEQRLPKEMEQYITLLHLKEKHLKALHREVQKKEEQLDTEEFISREAMQRLRASARDVRLETHKIISSKEKQPTE